MRGDSASVRVVWRILNDSDDRIFTGTTDQAVCGKAGLLSGVYGCPPTACGSEREVDGLHLRVGA